LLQLINETEAVAEFVHVPFEPTTVYVVFEEGVTDTEAPDRLPGFQVYDVAPLAVKVVVCPEQIVVELVANVGVAAMVTTAVLLPEQAPFTPTTV
jgi:hypothetical protein